MAIRKDRDAKAELNRRSQACDVLTGTGISRREKKNRKLENPVPEAGSLIGFAVSCRTQLPDVSTRPGRSRDRVNRHARRLRGGAGGGRGAEGGWDLFGVNGLRRRRREALA